MRKNGMLRHEITINLKHTMSKFIDITEAADKVKDGMTIMVGGFLANGSAERVIDAIVEKGTKDLTIIANDSSYSDRTIGKLLKNGQVKKLIVSYIGATPEAVTMMNNGELEVEFVPQGTLAERVRAGGSGLGGFLTPTGVGTEIAEGKEHITVNGREYLLELPLRADVALIGASVADGHGNLVYKGTSGNFNPLMATAADIVIAEPKETVESGTIAPECVHTPYILVDYVVNK